MAPEPLAPVSPESPSAGAAVGSAAAASASSALATAATRRFRFKKVVSLIALRILEAAATLIVGNCAPDRLERTQGRDRGCAVSTTWVAIWGPARRPAVRLVAPIEPADPLVAAKENPYRGVTPQPHPVAPVSN